MKIEAIEAIEAIEPMKTIPRPKKKEFTIDAIFEGVFPLLLSKKLKTAQITISYEREKANPDRSSSRIKVTLESSKPVLIKSLPESKSYTVGGPAGQGGHLNVHQTQCPKRARLHVCNDIGQNVYFQEPDRGREAGASLRQQQPRERQQAKQQQGEQQGD